jgi:hypothetical protein
MEMRLGLFIGKAGIERIMPGGSSLAETEAGLVLFRALRQEIAEFDAAIRRKLAGVGEVEAEEATPESAVLVGTTN